LPQHSRLCSSRITVSANPGDERSNGPSLDGPNDGAHILTEQECAYLLEIQFTIQNVLRVPAFIVLIYVVFKQVTEILQVLLTLEWTV
jgi:hypothetical protein